MNENIAMWIAIGILLALGALAVIIDRRNKQ
jgi:hypothetical protein